MTQVMGDGTCHPSNGCQALRFEQILLGLEQAFAHGFERTREFRSFVPTIGLQRIPEVTFLKGGNSGEETQSGRVKVSDMTKTNTLPSRTARIPNPSSNLFKLWRDAVA